MKFYLLGLLTLVFAWLLPFHRSPWPTFGSEILTFISASILLFGFYKTRVLIPRAQVLILAVVTVPAFQLIFGQVIYTSNAILCTAYILMFWCMVVAGFNLSDSEEKREKVFNIFCFALLGVGLISSLIAIFQWLSLNSYFSPWMYAFKGNRPYANLAQPNNLATLLTVSLLACLYFYEKKLIKNIYLIPFSVILLFSIALTQSRTTWVVCLFILFYLPIKQWGRNSRFGVLKLISWTAVFILLISSLPLLNQLISISLNPDMIDTPSVIERASSGYLRFDMWQQQWIALMQQPWFGYGWNQTGLAQIAAFDSYPSREWYKSAHNIIFDLLIWNGVIIGGIIIFYLTAWLYWLNKGVKDTISIVATLMVCAILIHGMLEFPLHYAYFLLPVGFLLGIIQAQYSKLPSISIKGIWFALIALITISCSLMSIHDYFLYKKQSVIASQSEPLTYDQQKVMSKKILLLSQFEERIWWIQLNPQTQLNTAELAHIKRMVANMASKYDLYKYAQVLAFNGYKEEAKHQLWILETLHRHKRDYEDLLRE